MGYTTSLSDSGWILIQDFFLEKTAGPGRPRKHGYREIVNGIFYIVKNAVTWRDLPADFPPWTSVYRCFRDWSFSGLWQTINDALVADVRFAAGRTPSPSLASIDSQSQTAEPGVEQRGIDGGKKINGRKRQIAVDVQGLLLHCVCTAANVHDAVGGDVLVAALNDQKRFSNLEKILGDSAYQSVGENERVAVTIEAKERAPGQKGFVPEAFRWAVERSFAWLNRQRRLCRNFEKKTKHQESMNYIGNIRLCISRLLKWMK